MVEADGPAQLCGDGAAANESLRGPSRARTPQDVYTPSPAPWALAPLGTGAASASSEQLWRLAGDSSRTTWFSSAHKLLN